MERNIPPLLLILLVSFILSAPHPGAAKHIAMVDPHGYGGTWNEFVSHCVWRHDGVRSIRNLQEAEKISKLEGWIGMFKSGPGWFWFTKAGHEEATFFIWDDGEPVPGRYCVWKRQGQVKWKTDSCISRHGFACLGHQGILVQEILVQEILVQEKKTWEEALQHCRELHSDLVSLPGTDLIQLNREAIRQDANTDEVWVGLRFLAGEWLWMSGQAVQSSNLPQCPAPYLHCGAVVHNDTEFKIMDCTEKRNFLCSKKKT